MDARIAVALEMMIEPREWHLTDLRQSVTLDCLRAMDEKEWVEVAAIADQHDDLRGQGKPIPPGTPRYSYRGWASPMRAPNSIGTWETVWGFAPTMHQPGYAVRLTDKALAFQWLAVPLLKRGVPNTSLAATNGVAHDLREHLRRILDWFVWLIRADKDDAGPKAPEWWMTYVDDPEWHFKGKPDRPDPERRTRVRYARWRAERSIGACLDKWQPLTASIPFDDREQRIYQGAHEALRNLKGILGPAQMGTKLRYGVVPDDHHLEAPTGDLTPEQREELQRLRQDWRETIVRWRLREKAVRELLHLLEMERKPAGLAFHDAACEVRDALSEALQRTQLVRGEDGEWNPGPEREAAVKRIARMIQGPTPGSLAMLHVSALVASPSDAVHRTLETKGTAVIKAGMEAAGHLVHSPAGGSRAFVDAMAALNDAIVAFQPVFVLAQGGAAPAERKTPAQPDLLARLAAIPTQWQRMYATIGCCIRELRKGAKASTGVLRPLLKLGGGIFPESRSDGLSVGMLGSAGASFKDIDSGLPLLIAGLAREAEGPNFVGAIDERIKELLRIQDWISAHVRSHTNAWVVVELDELDNAPIGGTPTSMQPASTNVVLTAADPLANADGTALISLDDVERSILLRIGREPTRRFRISKLESDPAIKKSFKTLRPRLDRLVEIKLLDPPGAKAGYGMTRASLAWFDSQTKKQAGG